MILDMDINITVDGRPCSLEKDVLNFEDCVMRCVRMKDDNTLMYVKESRINIQNFNKENEFKNIQDMIGYTLLIVVASLYLSSSIVAINKLIAN